MLASETGGCLVEVARHPLTLKPFTPPAPNKTTQIQSVLAKDKKKHIAELQCPELLCCPRRSLELDNKKIPNWPKIHTCRWSCILSLLNCTYTCMTRMSGTVHSCWIPAELNTTFYKTVYLGESDPVLHIYSNIFQYRLQLLVISFHTFA